MRAGVISCGVDMILRNRRFAALAVAAVGSLLVVLGATDLERTEATHGGMDTMSIDMNPAGNSSGAVGTLDTCARINKNNTQDADEDFIDGLFVDITGEGIPAYNNNGTPSDASDDRGGLTGYQYALNYASQLTVSSQETSSATVNILAANNASPATIFNASEGVPDDETVNFNTWSSLVVDTGTDTPESGDGVLDRVSISVDAGITSGQYLITLTDNGHADASSAVYQPHSTGLANVAVGLGVMPVCGTLTTSLGYFHPITPVRILDTRTAPQGTPPGPAGPGGVITVDVTGVGGVPASGVTAVVANTTSVGSTQASHLTVYPSDAPLPLASNLNFAAGQTVPNLVTVKVGADGTVKIQNFAGTTHVIFDLMGWYGTPASGSRYTPLTPARILDTRFGPQGSPPGAVGPGGVITVDVTGVGGVPASAVTAVVINTTVVAPTQASHLTVYPSDAALPNVSNLNFVGGQTVPNLVTVKVGADGNVKARNFAGTVHVIFDVVGWYGTSSGNVLNPLSPSRIVDTRTGPQGVPPGPVGNNTNITVDVTGVGGVPVSGATAVIMNTTVTGPTQTSHLTVYPSDATLPNVSNLNYTPFLTVANLVVVKVGGDGNVKAHNFAGQVHVIFDVVGYFAPPP